MAVNRVLIRNVRIVRSTEHETIADANSPPVTVYVEIDPWPGGRTVVADLRFTCNLRKLTDFSTSPVTSVDLGSFDLKAAPGDTSGRCLVGFIAAPNAHGLAAGAQAPVQAIVTLKTDYIPVGATLATITAAAVKPAIDIVRWKRAA